MLILEQIPMRSDNYAYALIQDQQAIIIDPSDPKESLAFFADRPELELIAILNTHSHEDHVGGNKALSQTYKCPVYGPKLEASRIPCLSHPLEANEHFELSKITIIAHDVRAHTAGHMAFFVDKALDKIIKHGHGHDKFQATYLAGHKVLFVGDSLFAAGCGRLFEGTRENLVAALSFYAAQDPKTLMACGHEYSESNLRFAKSIFPNNQNIQKRLENTPELIKQEGSSVPCFFSEEFITNPFLLALGEPALTMLAQKFSLSSSDLPHIIGALRAAKDAF